MFVKRSCAGLAASRLLYRYLNISYLWPSSTSLSFSPYLSHMYIITPRMPSRRANSSSSSTEDCSRLFSVPFWRKRSIVGPSRSFFTMSLL